MKKDEKEVMATVKETLPLLSKSEKERFLAFAQGMLYIANKNKEASWGGGRVGKRNYIKSND